MFLDHPTMTATNAVAEPDRLERLQRAYGYAMANNYNGVPRPPVIFCSGGDARVVVRRETYADLRGRDA